MAAHESRSLLGTIFGSVWTAVVAPVIVSLLSAIIVYRLGIGGSQNDSPQPPVAPPAVKAAPQPDAGSSGPSVVREKGAEKPARQVEQKAAVSSDFEEFAK